MIEFFRRLPGALVFLGRGAVRQVFGNISLAMLSVALGLSLWLFVTDRENPKEVQTFNSAIPVSFVNVPNDLAVSNTSETNVRIRVEATKTDLDRLRAADFHATVDLGGFAKGQVTAAVNVVPSNGNVSVVSTTPDHIDVSLEDLRTNVVPVSVSLLGSPQQGFAAVNQTADPSSATVTGPESLVALVTTVVAEVNLTGLRADFTDNVDLKPRDLRGGDISRVKVDPQRARVAVKLDQNEFSQGFVINPSITGAPAAGYNITGISVDPPLVSVTGAENVLRSIDAVKGIATEEISIADSRSDVVRSVQITLPQGARVKDGPSAVRVTVSIQPIRGELTFSVVPQVRNIAAGLALAPPEPVLVTLSGELPALQALSPESIIATADAEGLGAGVHALPVSITPPAGTNVTRSEPGEVSVALTQRGGGG